MSTAERDQRTIELRVGLAVTREIDRRLSEIVRAAGQRAHLLHGDRAMRENQIRNVLDVAMSTESLDVVTNFIRYQMGRSGGNQAWLHENFGQAVVQDIETRGAIVQRLADEVAGAVCHEVQEADRNQVMQAARVRLMRLYLGYLNRWFYYGFKTRRWSDVEAATREGAGNVRQA